MHHTCLFKRFALGLGMAVVLFLAGCAQTRPTATDAFSARYRCTNGECISARYAPPDTAIVHRNQQRIDMHIARSADGARYVGGGLVWWTKGSGPGSMGTLFVHETATQSTGQRITSCRQIAAN